MSRISDALRVNPEVLFLVEIEGQGFTWRISTKTVSVPDSSGPDRLFDGIILNNFNIGATFDIKTWKYSISDIPITISAKDRPQDLEAITEVDGATGRIWIWTPGLTWQDIETDGLIFTGVFEKQGHDDYRYVFNLIEETKYRLYKVPPNTINPDTWPAHRIAGGSGSVQGMSVPLIFGNWAGSIPLLCVDTARYKYLATEGVVKSVQADYAATPATVNVYDKNGSVIAASNYALTSGSDAKGHAAIYFDFTGDYTGSEPLVCSIQGLVDGSGAYTGTAGGLIEHPADIVHYLLGVYSGLALDRIDVGSLRTLKSLLPGIKFVGHINAPVEGIDLIDAILYYCRAARVIRKGKIGVVTLNPNLSPVGRIDENSVIRDTVSFSKTPPDATINNLEWQFGLLASIGQYAYVYRQNPANNVLCKASMERYGELPKSTMAVPWVRDTSTMSAIGARWMGFHALRHDLVTFDMPYAAAWDIEEGDGRLLTLPGGSSRDGKGWIDEPCILIERILKKSTIGTRWWRIAA